MRVRVMVAAILVLATATTTMTLTKGSLFEQPRAWLAEKNAWLGKVLSCPYCTSHWVAFLYAPVIATKVGQSIGTGTILTWWLTSMSLVALATPVEYMIVLCQRGMQTKGN